MPAARQLVLASTSRYRRALLERLGLPFECAAPEIDESPLQAEAPADTALRLAQRKARAVAARFPDALIIGSDQVASCGAARLDKPGDHANALRQLELLSGRTARFDTALSLLDSRNAALRSRIVSCEVTFRVLSRAQMEAYLHR